jgi:hypothetical protein
MRNVEIRKTGTEDFNAKVAKRRKDPGILLCNEANGELRNGWNGLPCFHRVSAELRKEGRAIFNRKMTPMESSKAIQGRDAPLLFSESPAADTDLPYPPHE